jgi:hypothetical protein
MEQETLMSKEEDTAWAAETAEFRQVVAGLHEKIESCIQKLDRCLEKLCLIGEYFGLDLSQCEQDG